MVGVAISFMVCRHLLQSLLIYTRSKKNLIQNRPRNQQFSLAGLAGQDRERSFSSKEKCFFFFFSFAARMMLSGSCLPACLPVCVLLSFWLTNVDRFRSSASSDKDPRFERGQKYTTYITYKLLLFLSPYIRILMRSQGYIVSSARVGSQQRIIIIWSLWRLLSGEKIEL